MMTSTGQITALIWIIPSLAFSLESVSFSGLIECGRKNSSGQGVALCKPKPNARNLIIFSGHQYESEVTVSYRITCNVHSQWDSGFRLEHDYGVDVIYVQTSEDKNFMTSAPIVLTYDESYLPSLYFPEGCDFEISSTVETPSERIMAQWLEDLEEYKAEIRNIEDSIRGWQAALDTYAIYDAVREVSNLFYKDLTNPDLLAVRERSATIAAAIAHSLASSECGLFTEEEKSAFASAMTALFVLHDPSKWAKSDGSAKRFEEFFAEEDRVALESLMAKYDLESRDSFQTSIDEARVRLGEVIKATSDTEILIKRYSN